MKKFRLMLIALLASMPVPVYAMSAQVIGESLVLTGTEPGTLLYDHIVPGSLQLRSAYDPATPGCVFYEAGKDFTVDTKAGRIARTADSRIPDYSTNVLYGQHEFDHTKFPGYGNKPFFVYVDYESVNAFPVTAPSSQGDLLVDTREKLAAGHAFKVITYGDSISAGGEATQQRLRFDERYAKYLQARHPRARVALENGATGGDATPQGLARLEEKVLTREPDLVLVGFGMNDHNVNGVPVEKFEENLVSIVQQIKERTGADVLLFSTFPPNPDWKHSSHQMAAYAAATARAAQRTASAFADVHAVWQRVLQRKDLPSLLANNINHPNDFGHWLYYQALASVGF